MRSVFAILLLLVACSPEPAPAPEPGAPPGEEAAGTAEAEAAISARIEAFGSELRGVTLLAPEDQLRAAIESSYAEHVTDALLASWLANPTSAPGQQTSSPWPDRVEVLRVEVVSETEARAEAEIVEATSTGDSGRIPVEVTLRSVNDEWRIASWEAGERAPEASEPAVGTPSDAAAVVASYYAAIDAGDYERAYGLWSDGASDQTLAEFRAGFAETEAVAVETGEPGRIEGAAGSRYVTIPVEITATTSTGATQRFAGSYVLRRSVVDGATAEQRAWRIHSADLRQIAG